MHGESTKLQAERLEQAAQAARAAVLLRARSHSDERQGWRTAPAVVLATGWGVSRGS